MADGDRELGLLEDAAKASGPADEQQPYMVAIDRRTGKAVAAWKGSNRRVSFDVEVEQYAVSTNSLSAAKRHGEVLHQQRGRKQEGA